MDNKTKLKSLLLHLIFCGAVTFALDGQASLPFIAWWFAVINVFEFAMFGKDKLRAKMSWSRTPESTFLIMGLLGAFPAILAGRKAFNHKTTKKEFIIPMWSLFILQIVLAIAYIENVAVKGTKFLGFVSL
tara:strand:- start:213665 stop:214057 length:393 start_codon:yes stop_codon:yes gene_type:complete